MSLGSRLKIESKGMLATSVFYAIVGIVFLVLLPMSGFPPHIGILGILSLITAYGVFRKRTWSIWFVVILFLAGTTFASFMIYGTLTNDAFLSLSAAAYLIFTWVFTAYAGAKRKTLEH